MDATPNVGSTKRPMPPAVAPDDPYDFDGLMEELEDACAERGFSCDAALVTHLQCIDAALAGRLFDVMGDVVGALTNAQVRSLIDAVRERGLRRAPRD